MNQGTTFQQIILLRGFSQMSEGRKAWIDDFLKLCAYPALRLLPVSTMSPDQHSLAELSHISPRQSCLIGHEIPNAVCQRLDEMGLTYIDIRVSPARFHERDFILAINSNSSSIRALLGRHMLNDEALHIEALALKLSLRYRDFNQGVLKENAAVIIPEKAADHDSLNWGLDLSLAEKSEHLREACTAHAHIHYVTTSDIPVADRALLDSIGATPVATNLYGIFCSDRVRTIIAKRSGALEEARYFDKQTIALDTPGTPLARTREAPVNAYFNIECDVAFRRSFWEELLCGYETNQICADRPFFTRDILRRAVNEWNSYAVVRQMHTKEWQQAYFAPTKKLVATLGRAISELVPAQESLLPIIGRWHWFTGDVIDVLASGIAVSSDDFGAVSLNGDKEWQIRWIGRDISDYVRLNEGRDILTGRNQYGDSVSGSRL
ncbi:hypothetical protein [Gluconobacter oxydans]|uniref:hypothetical protein n=1 Tax=Gluconobacter oxydans TaxID=442 RepID=UPI000A7808EB|nr:hypothetical protein [Gluconobacter oxydans]